MVTGKSDAALDGVYKLSEINGEPKMKFSENIEKNTLPGKKAVYRYFDENGYFYRDALLLENEDPNQIDTIYHPVYPEKNSAVHQLKFESLLQKVVDGGEILFQNKSLSEIHQYLMQRADLLPDEHKRFISPHIYKVGISEKLMNTRNELTKKLFTQNKQR
jgi:nicotinate phosphoribosyltransferase